MLFALLLLCETLTNWLFVTLEWVPIKEERNRTNTGAIRYIVKSCIFTYEYP